MAEPLSEEEIAEGLRVYNPGDPEYRALAELQRIRSAERVGWRTIESAPKDAMRLLLIRAGYDDAAFIGSWNLYRRDDSWQDDAGELGLDERPPTHWMPLPAPPDTPATGDGR